jgi:hypothetical protein
VEAWIARHPAFHPNVFLFLLPLNDATFMITFLMFSKLSKMSYTLHAQAKLFRRHLNQSEDVIQKDKLYNMTNLSDFLYWLLYIGV